MSRLPEDSPSASRPLLSVIVPTCNRGPQLRDCLQRLSPETQTLPADCYEVIVTDDGKAQSAEHLVSSRYSWARWVQGPSAGPAANRNHGARFAQGKWLVFIDDDCLPEPELLAAFAQQTSGEALALEGAIHPIGDADQDLAECPVNTTGGYFWSANVAVERSLFERMGGFDPDYPMAAHEDQDLHFRLLRQTQVKFVPEAKVFHRVRVLGFWSSLKRIPKKVWAWAVHVSKHRADLGFETNGKLVRKECGAHLRIALKNLLRGKWKTALYSLVWLLIGVPMTLGALRKMHRDRLRH